MGLSIRARLLLAAPLLLLYGTGARAEEPVVSLRWGLSDEQQLFKEVRSAPGAALRHFKLDVRKANAEGAEACVEEAAQGQPPRDFCQALAKRLAPVFSFAFETAQPGVFIFDRIEVECFKSSTHRGVGFVKDNAFYELLLPARPGVVQREPVKKLIFNTAGTAEIRAWPDLEAQQPVGSLELEIRFHFHSGATRSEVKTGHFVLSF